jgi:DNA-binding beta-propeller fold protein YncE
MSSLPWPRRRSARTLAAAAAIGAAIAIPMASSAQETVGPGAALTGNGRHLEPAGRLTPVGSFPTGGALTPDGRFYWTVDAGRGATSVRVVEVGTGVVKQALPIPGGYVGIAFSPDGTRAYVSGEPADGDFGKGLKGEDGDVIHVFGVDPASGAATELEPIALPDAKDGAAAQDELPQASAVNAWPEGLDVTPDGKYLVVALGQADQVAIVDLSKAGGPGTLADVGRYPYGVVIDPKRPRAYVTNERDGTVSVVEIPSGKLLATIEVGGERGAAYAHPEGIAADPVHDRVYVAVTDRDLVAVLDTKEMKLERYVDVGRSDAAIGTAPVEPSVGPSGDTLYVANAGEDAVVAIALERRPPAKSKPHSVVRVRSITKIKRFRTARAKARRARARHRLSRKGYTRRVKSLRKRYLLGTAKKACAGPTRKQDAAYGRAVLRALDQRAKALRRHQARRRADRAFMRRIATARRKLPGIARCAAPGFIPNAKPFSIVGRIPTAAYPTDVEVSSDGKTLAWLAAKGLGTGPNNGAEHDISRLTTGQAGVLGRPTDQGARALTATANRQIIPTNSKPPPPGTPLVGADGGPSDKIKYVFYVVRENRTYDQIFGSEPRGRGDPRLQLFDDNGVPGPTGGVTPNAHALARTFPLLDNVYANSEESTTGHKITAGAYANDYTQRFRNSGRGRKGNSDIFPIGHPPNAFVFDQAVRQGIPFRVYGELGAGNQPFGDDGRPTYSGVIANTDNTYPSQVQGTCRPFGQNVPGPNSVRCTADSGTVSTGVAPPTTGPPNQQSRINTFQSQFQQQVAAGTVPRFNYAILFNDHTDGTTPGTYTPKANVADNDLALGQFVELVSQSSIWKDSAIFVIEDDSQDGIDSVDAHRIPALVISPWAKRGVVVSTRYDHYSFLRTAEMVAGLLPLSLNDALATPLYDAFISGSEQPDVEGTRYRAIQPEQSMTETNPAGAAQARLSMALPFDQVDVVPQRLSDEIIWKSVFGADAVPPPAGPNASPVERARAVGALKRLRAGKSARRWLLQRAGVEEEEEEEGPRASVTATLRAFGR